MGIEGIRVIRRKEPEPELSVIQQKIQRIKNFNRNSEELGELYKTIIWG